MSIVQVSPLRGGEADQPPGTKQRSANQTKCRDVKQRLCALFDEIFAHESYGDIRVEIRILGRGMKEVVLHCGKQYCFVVPYRRAVADVTRRRA